ncbi:MAG: sensor histidine kinase [Saprospiraceae bacterium]
MVLFGIDVRRYLIRGFLLTRKKWVYHSIFWLVMLLALVELGNNHLNLAFRFLLEGTNIFFYILVTYINLFYLIPNFLTGKKREWLFIGSLLLVCAVITPIKLITLYFLHRNFPQIQNELINNQFWYFLGLVYIAGFSTIYSIISEWKKQEKQRVELQNQTVASELRFLKTQINPHFLFNTLNSLYALTLKKSDDAPEVVLRLSEMMRYMLYECNEPQVPLTKEVAYIENYLNLEKLRLSKTIDLKFNVSGDTSNLSISPLLFIPFIENSFKHGVANQIGEGFVHIDLICKEKELSFCVENSRTQNNSLGHHSGKRSGGIGLINVKRRLDLLYPNKNKLKIEEGLNTFKVCLCVNC